MTTRNSPHVEPPSDSEMPGYIAGMEGPLLERIGSAAPRRKPNRKRKIVAIVAGLLVGGGAVGGIAWAANVISSSSVTSGPTRVRLGTPPAGARYIHVTVKFVCSPGRRFELKLDQSFVYVPTSVCNGSLAKETFDYAFPLPGGQESHVVTVTTNGDKLYSITANYTADGKDSEAQMRKDDQELLQRQEEQRQRAQQERFPALGN